MPFFEGFGLFIGYALLLGIAVVGICFWGGVLLVVAAITAAIGWIPILAVYSDPDWVMRFDGNFIEAWSAWAMLEYVVLIGGWVAMSLIVSNGGELPKGLQVIAWMFPHSGRAVVREGTQRSLLHKINGRRLARELGNKPASVMGMKIKAHQSKKMAEELEAETAWVEAEEEVARKTVELERARARAEALKRSRS
jgi:signal transduction histidine kinase